MSNILYHGDNILGLKYLLDEGYSGKIDLVYIDPPYSTGNSFTVTNTRTNTLGGYNNESRVAYEDKFTLEDYLFFINIRLEFINELLSSNGSIYVHSDIKVGHRVRTLMDNIFGINNFRNEITRIKCNPKNFKQKKYGNIKDVIYFYSKGKDYIWNNSLAPYTQEDINRLFKKTDSNGLKYTTSPLHAPGETKNGDTNKPFKGVLPPEGHHWRKKIKDLEELDAAGRVEWSDNNVPRKIIYPSDTGGMKRQDIWEYKDPSKPLYPTEKNLDMLKTIIMASSNEESIVMDCFSGSGSTLLAAQELNRKWIGMDESNEAISVIRNRLKKADYKFIKT